MKIILRAKQKKEKSNLLKLVGKTDTDGSVCELHNESPFEISFTSPELEVQKTPNVIMARQMKQGINKLMFVKEGIHESEYIIRFE